MTLGYLARHEWSLNDTSELACHYVIDVTEEGVVFNFPIDIFYYVFIMITRAVLFILRHHVSVDDVGVHISMTFAPDVFSLTFISIARQRLP